MYLLLQTTITKYYVQVLTESSFMVIQVEMHVEYMCRNMIPGTVNIIKKFLTTPDALCNLNFTCR